MYHGDICPAVHSTDGVTSLVNALVCNALMIVLLRRQQFPAYTRDQEVELQRWRVRRWKSNNISLNDSVVVMLDALTWTDEDQRFVTKPDFIKLILPVYMVIKKT